MVQDFLFTPFPETIFARLYAAVQAALQLEGDSSTVLFGNLPVEYGAAGLPAVVFRPHSITLLLFVAGSGRLSIPALGYGAWLLDGQPLGSAPGFDNPFEQFVQQKTALGAWLQAQIGVEQASMRFISGIVLFAGPVTFGPDVEPQLNSPAANNFQLLSDPHELPRRLRQLATPEIDLTTEDLTQLAALRPAAPPMADSIAPEVELEEEPEPDTAVEASPAPNFLTQKARQLWGWLGAADIPDDDPPYGYDSTASAARQEEKQQLEALRQQMQADLTSQLQALEVREAERERSIAQLRAELAQAPPVAAEAAALVSRLGAETREKAALEAAMAASRAESATRNQELDAKIQQLSQLIAQLHAQPTAAGLPATAASSENPTGAAVAAHPATAAQPPRFWQLRVWRRRLPRLAVLVGGLTAAGLGAWGLSHLNQKPPMPFQENGRWGFADGQGTAVVPARYSAAEPFRDGRAVVARDGAYGFLGEDGQEVVAPAYDALNPYAGGYARVRVGDTYTYLDEKGEEFPAYYFNALDFAEGYAAVLDHRGWHYISGPTPATAPPVIFTEAYSFVDGLARVKLPDGFTYITPDYLTDPTEGTKPFGRYEAATDFADGKARVTQQGRSFFIDHNGDEVK